MLQGKKIKDTPALKVFRYKWEQKYINILYRCVEPRLRFWEGSKTWVAGMLSHAPLSL